MIYGVDGVVSQTDATIYEVTARSMLSKSSVSSLTMGRPKCFSISFMLFMERYPSTKLIANPERPNLPVRPILQMTPSNKSHDNIAHCRLRCKFENGVTYKYYLLTNGVAQTS